jgi:3'(2'), 5'-bisphosphate nucleotidase
VKIIDIYDKPSFGLKIKENNLPLTEADHAANKFIHAYLVKTDIPIIS